MGLNFDINFSKLPHIWQTVIAMVVGGVFIGTAAVFAAVKISQVKEVVKDVNEGVEANGIRLERVESTQAEIMSIQASNAAQMEDIYEDLTSEIEKVDGRLVYSIEHQEDMTAKQILDAFDIGYTNGYDEGKKNEMNP